MTNQDLSPFLLSIYVIWTFVITFTSIGYVQAPIITHIR